MEIKLTNLANSEIELEGEIASADFDAKRDSVLKRLQTQVKIDGFREGINSRQSWKINSVQNEFFGNGGTGARGMVPKNCAEKNLM